MLWTRKDKQKSGEIAAKPDASEIGEPVACMLSDPGCCRQSNEDNARIVHVHGGSKAEHSLLAIVADGMGGYRAGEVASRIAVETVEREYSILQGNPGEALEKAFHKAHLAIRKQAKQNPALAGMGTTCTAIVIEGLQLWAVHVGDSRLYLVREGEIYQLSEDHTQCMEMVRKGLLTLDEARHHTDRNVLTHAMGTREDLTLMAWPESMMVKPRDVFLLCSDGLHDLVSDAEMKRMVWDMEPATACRNLIQKARDRGGYDNITLVVVVISATNGGQTVLKDTAQYEVIR